MDAIFEATIQLLLSGGMTRLTTTRVAERAGVSVGTMYQYFPNKQALIYALNERYLQALAQRIEDTCAKSHGAPIERMVEALVDTYWQAKMERADLTEALYRSVAELDNEALIEAFAARANTATVRMFESAPGAAFADLERTNLTLVTVIFGAVRNAFERRLGEQEAIALRGELVTMCQAYLRAITT